MSYDRHTLQQLADQRLAEATFLLESGFSSGAYYLAGYAIECALKAKICGQFRADEIPDRALVNGVYDHDLTRLLSLANLKEDHVNAVNTDPDLRRYWTVIVKWKPDARYRIWTTDDAANLLEAVGSEKGLMRWLLSR